MRKGMTKMMEGQNGMTSLTVVELFQSQGCSSCPPTNSNIIQLSQDPNYLVLTYEVTYWDYLGWKDTFGNSAFDRRQWDYAKAMNNSRVYTPQVCFVVLYKHFGMIWVCFIYLGDREWCS